MGDDGLGNNPGLADLVASRGAPARRNRLEPDDGVRDSLAVHSFVRVSGGVGQVDLSDLAPTFLHLLDRPENPSLSGSPLDAILY